MIPGQGHIVLLFFELSEYLDQWNREGIPVEEVDNDLLLRVRVGRGHDDMGKEKEKFCRVAYRVSPFI